MGGLGGGIPPANDGNLRIGADAIGIGGFLAAGPENGAGAQGNDTGPTVVHSQNAVRPGKVQDNLMWLETGKRLRSYGNRHDGVSAIRP